MIKHIVLWRMKENAEGRTLAENAREMKARIEALKKSIPQIVELEVGLPIETTPTTSDVALYSSFKNREDLDQYQNHPEHLKVVDFVKKITVERRAVDYEF